MHELSIYSMLVDYFNGSSKTTWNVRYILRIVIVLWRGKVRWMSTELKKEKKTKIQALLLKAKELKSMVSHFAFPLLSSLYVLTPDKGMTHSFTSNFSSSVISKWQSPWPLYLILEFFSLLPPSPILHSLWVCPGWIFSISAFHHLTNFILLICLYTVLGYLPPQPEKYQYLHDR